MVVIRYERLGSWKCGIGRTFPSFPQALFFFIRDKIYKNNYHERGENRPKPTNSPPKPLLMGIHSKLLTILFQERGEII